MNRTLHVADAVDLPIDFVTDSNALMGMRGSGKTSGGIVLLEEMFAAGVPVVSIDPKGDHYGIRASADGRSEGLPIPVFGGRHGDLPLEPTAGVYLADLVLTKRLSCVLDVSEFSKADERRFLTAFADRLYRAADREPMHVFLEECHEYIPQRVDGGDAAMVGVFERLVKQGRYKGIGVTLMSQRSASVNKNVLTQVDNLFVMRTASAQDRAAIKGWITDNVGAADILAQLPSLQNGETWLWQPRRGEPIHFRFRMRNTFDAGETPKVGQVRVQPTTLADVDLTAIAAAMADTIEKVKADDPRHLRKQLADRDTRIRQLEAELARAQAATPEPVVQVREVPVITDEQMRTLTHQANLLHQSVLDLMRGAITNISMTADILAALAVPTAGGKATSADPPPEISEKSVATTQARRPIDKFTITKPPQTTDGVVLSKAERTILAVLATHGTLRAQQVSLLSGYSVKSSSFANALGKLRSNQYAVGGKEAISITELGHTALGDYEPLPTGRALIDHWMGNLARAERTILEALITAWPGPLTNEEIADTTGYSTTSSSFANALGRLRSLELARGGRDANFAADTLGEAAH
jgi:hypothetical protein